jgi:hypothetical protein
LKEQQIHAAAHSFCSTGQFVGGKKVNVIPLISQKVMHKSIIANNHTTENSYLFAQWGAIL